MQPQTCRLPDGVMVARFDPSTIVLTSQESGDSFSRVAGSGSRNGQKRISGVRSVVANLSARRVCPQREMELAKS